MKRIVFTATYTKEGTEVGADRVPVFAANINSGFKKATPAALRGLPAGWELFSLVFTAVE